MTSLAKCFAVAKWMPYVVLLVVGFSAHSNIKVSVSDLLMFLSGLFWEGDWTDSTNSSAGKALILI